MCELISLSVNVCLHVLLFPLRWTVTSDMMTPVPLFPADRENSRVATGTTLTPAVCPASFAKVKGCRSSSSLSDTFLHLTPWKQNKNSPQWSRSGHCFDLVVMVMFETNCNWPEKESRSLAQWCLGDVGLSIIESDKVLVISACCLPKLPRFSGCTITPS